MIWVVVECVNKGSKNLDLYWKYIIYTICLIDSLDGWQPFGSLKSRETGAQSDSRFTVGSSPKTGSEEQYPFQDTAQYVWP